MDNNDVNSITSNDYVLVLAKDGHEGEATGDNEVKADSGGRCHMATKCDKNRSLDTIETQNTSLFFNITYLGCCSIQAPKSEIEINRVINDLSTATTALTHIDVILSIPTSANEYIQLFDSISRMEIAKYKMSQVLFVMRGKSECDNCFAFTTCHGDSIDNLIFPCHVYRTELNEAVSKILYSFWIVFKRQQIMLKQQHASISETTEREGSVGGIEQTMFNGTNGRTMFADRAFRYANGHANMCTQHEYRILLDIQELNGMQYTSVARDKDCFKLRRNLDKIVHVIIQRQQAYNTYGTTGAAEHFLDICRCFGVLLCAGRNCNVQDMQLLETKSLSQPSIASQTNQEYHITALWNPREPQYAILNQETQKNMKVFITIAIDLVIDCVLEPIRFLIETKCRIFAQNEKFWSFNQSTKQNRYHQEDFYVLLKAAKPIDANNFHLHSIHSHTELTRKLNQHDLEMNKQKQLEENGHLMDNVDDDDDDEDDSTVLSGMVIDVSKDFVNDDNHLTEWTTLIHEWRENHEERPKDLQYLMNDNNPGISESLRGELWQLLAGCYQDAKTMHDSYKLCLHKESSCEQVILRDINRTFPGHAYFQDECGQQALYKLSKAYSIYDQEIGYCQGLSFLIATLLLHMPEEQAFNLLCKIMYNYKVRDIYKAGFDSLHLRLHQFEQLLTTHIPTLYEHFVDLNIETHMYASQWFLTLYTSKFPLYMVCRIIDLFLYYGFNVLFTIGIAILKNATKDLLMLDFEGVLKYFRLHLPKKYRNVDYFNAMLDIWQSQIHFKVTNKMLLKYEKNYELLKRIERVNNDAQLRADRENKTSQQQIRRLEQENDDLANEFINYRIGLNKKHDQLKDANDNLQMEINKIKHDQMTKYCDFNDTIAKYKLELDNIKQLYRSNIDNYEFNVKQIESIKLVNKNLNSRLQTIKNETKIELNNLIDQIASANLTSASVVVNESISKAIDTFRQHNELYLRLNDDQFESASSSLSMPYEQTKTAVAQSTLVDPNDRIKELELELASIKLELVNEKCLNQDLSHRLKQAVSSPMLPNTANDVQINTNSTNRWFNKTLTQFKEATSQVVQKVNSKQ